MDFSGFFSTMTRRHYKGDNSSYIPYTGKIETRKITIKEITESEIKLPSAIKNVKYLITARTDGW